LADLNHLIDNFLDFLFYQKNYSEHSINSYKRDLKLFLNFTQGNSNSIEQLNKRSCRQFLYYIEQNKAYQAKSLSRLISTLRSFWNYLMQESLATENPWLSIRLPKIPKRIPKVISTKQMTQFLEGIPITDPVGIRDRLICELLYGSGLRVSELANLRVTDLSLEKKECRIMGKGSKVRLALLSPPSCELLQLYKHSVRPIWAKEQCEELIVNQKGLKLSVRSIQRLLKKRCDDSTLSIQITPHDLRHSFATDLYNGGADLSIIKELLGHKHISSTEIYTHVSNQSLEKAMKNAHPSNRIE